MKKTKRLYKQLSLSKETVRSLSAADLDRAMGGKVIHTDSDGGNLTSCNTACGIFSCSVC